MFSISEVQTSIKQFASSNGTITLRGATLALKPFGLSVHARITDGAMCKDFSGSLIAQRISETHNIYRASDVLTFASKQLT
ncbi:hypothetical protein PsAD2_03011 [Pseudovibrio axinellae]|uniref:Uncharacterized protein n=1 Tax=Pseudovibrio axinellae TaxID=989403 RepID=A0A165XG89_9HYPH|nr:hypothetical protein [Pseudovibrio axinellae]KZL17675.1 hypothetical protein PsAD2_03011 [Pseudovibrio axinellae]SER44087.1 hypothetical protein SAMN05421798_11071 [Pseudovibrio axinellae]